MVLLWRVAKGEVIRSKVKDMTAHFRVCVSREIFTLLIGKVQLYKTDISFECGRFGRGVAYVSGALL